MLAVRQPCALWTRPCTFQAFTDQLTPGALRLQITSDRRSHTLQGGPSYTAAQQVSHSRLGALAALANTPNSTVSSDARQMSSPETLAALPLVSIPAPTRPVDKSAVHPLVSIPVPVQPAATNVRTAEAAQTNTSRSSPTSTAPADTAIPAAAGDSNLRSPTIRGRLTLSSIYGIAAPSSQDILSHTQLLSRRREREIKEIMVPAQKAGMSEAQLRSNIDSMQSLVPDMTIPDLNKMPAKQWVTLLSDVNRVASVIITLKVHFPRASISKILSVSPKILLKDPSTVDSDAIQVKSMLVGADDIDAIIEAVPNLASPQQLALSLSNLCAWFNKTPEGAVALLQENPGVLLNVEEATLEADPLYGAIWGTFGLRTGQRSSPPTSDTSATSGHNVSKESQP